MAAAVLNRAFHANQRGGGLLTTFNCQWHAKPPLARLAGPGHVARTNDLMQDFDGITRLAEQIECKFH